MKKIIIFFGLTILMSIQLCHAEWYSISSNCNIQTTCTALSGNYTINKFLPTFDKNYNSFTEAIEALKCGGISGVTNFYIASGTYDEQIRIPYISGTSDVDTITFTSQSGNNTDVVLQPTINIYNSVILLDSCSHIRLNNITVKNFSSNNSIRLQKGARDIVFCHNRIIGTPSDTSIILHKVSKIRIINNRISECNYCVYCGNASNIEISNNNLSDFHFIGIHLWANSKRISIEKNNFVSLNKSDDCSGIAMVGVSIDTVSINNNLIRIKSNTNAIGFVLWFIWNHTNIYNNIISLEAINTRGLLVGIGGAKNLQFVHNTLNAKNNSLQNGLNSCIYLSATSKNNYIQNNIFVSDGFASIFWIYWGDISQNQIDNNVYFTKSCVFGYNNQTTTTYSTQLDWSNATGYDTHSIFYKPTFISDSDLHLLSADQNLRLNNPIPDITTDFDGDLRHAANPYAGADEYISSLAFDVMNRCALQLAKFTLNNTSNISNTKWDFGDSQTSTQLSPTHTYTIAGTYNVSVDITYSTSTQTISKSVNINSVPLKLEIKHE